MPRNLRLLIEYDGTDYAGWQAQDNALTIQAVIERAGSRIVREDIRLTGAGRTDAGVHAWGQVANFVTSSPIPCAGLKRALNDALPRDIGIRRVDEVHDRFHSRFDARSRTYVYTLLNRDDPSTMSARYEWHYRRPIPVDVWDDLCQRVPNTRDFASFRKTGSSRTSTLCDVSDCRCWNEADRVFVSISADAFLRGMVRALVGTLVRVAPEIGIGREAAGDEFQRILDARDRSCAGESAPPQGLCLTHVAYDL